MNAKISGYTPLDHECTQRPLVNHFGHEELNPFLVIEMSIYFIFNSVVKVQAISKLRL